jgi:hypothetical protein
MNDVHNADETALFYKLMPNKTLVSKGERCTGSKNSKERITVLLCTNSTGTDKLLPLVTGKCRSPWCFKNMHKLPCEYCHNAKAWMTGEIFQEWILSLECRTKAEKQKILFLIDNCLAHKNVPRHVENIKVVLLPPNCTSICNFWIRE